MRIAMIVVGVLTIVGAFVQASSAREGGATIVVAGIIAALLFFALATILKKLDDIESKLENSHGSLASGINKIFDAGFAKKKTCTKCGALISADAIACPKCGQ